MKIRLYFYNEEKHFFQLGQASQVKSGNESYAYQASIYSTARPAILQAA